MIAELLRELRLWCADRHERRKDRTYRERLEEQRMQLDCQLLAQRVGKGLIENLRVLETEEGKPKTSTQQTRRGE